MSPSGHKIWPSGRRVADVCQIDFRFARRLPDAWQIIFPSGRRLANVCQIFARLARRPPGRVSIRLAGLSFIPPLSELSTSSGRPRSDRKRGSESDKKKMKKNSFVLAHLVVSTPTSEQELPSNIHGSSNGRMKRRTGFLNSLGQAAPQGSVQTSGKCGPGRSRVCQTSAKPKIGLPDVWQTSGK